MPIRLDMPSVTPETAVETVGLDPPLRPNSTPPPNEELELIQVVTDPTIMARAETIRSRVPSVTPGAGRTACGVVGCGAKGLAERRGPGTAAADAAMVLGPTSVQPVPALQRRRRIQSLPSQYVCSFGVARTGYHPGSLGRA